MPCVTQSDRRKLLALALASLLTSGKKYILSEFYFKVLTFFKFDFHVDGKSKKTCLIAYWMFSGSPVVIDRIYSVFLNVTETLNDIIKTDDETHTMVE